MEDKNCSNRAYAEENTASNTERERMSCFSLVLFILSGVFFASLFFGLAGAGGLDAFLLCLPNLRLLALIGIVIAGGAMFGSIVSLLVGIKQKWSKEEKQEYVRSLFEGAIILAFCSYALVRLGT